jgi:hypothetical protein
MRLLKAQNTNLRNIRGRGIQYDVNGQVTVNSKNSFLFPRGTTQERPALPQEGMIRYNTDLSAFEFYEGGSWSRGLPGVADNVYYVSKNGSDSNVGTSIAEAFATINKAMSVAKPGSTVYVKSGDYTINNPIDIPEQVALVGDSLRTVTIRAGNPTQDMFYVRNGSYITQVTFKDHESPSAAVSFNPDGSAGVIHTSPYVQNCTSMTTTGTGMRVDGSYVQGLKSMVVDAFTQYNQGGIGIHMLNLGNTQLVSVFTICCDVAILCESGGFCSLTNSNSSFGNFALKADGVSPAKYTGTVAQTIINPTFTDSSVFIKDLIARPNSGDAVDFGDGEYYTVRSSSNVRIGDTVVENPDLTNEAGTLQLARTTVVDAKDQIKFDTIEYLNTTYPAFSFNQSKCARDIGLILDAALEDMVLNTNYQSITAGRSYRQGPAAEVINSQLAQTIDGIEFARDEALALLTPATTEYNRLQANINLILDIIQNGESAVPAIQFNDPTGVIPAVTRAKNILLNNKDFYLEEGIAYITANYPDLTYNETTCRRDISYVVDSIIYDILYQGNSQSLFAAEQYYYNGSIQVGTGEKLATIDTFKYIRSLATRTLLNVIIGSPLQQAVSQDTSVPATTVEQSNKVNELFTIVTTYLESGSYINGFVEIQEPAYNTQEEDALTIRETILSAKEQIQIDTIDFINENFQNLNYDEGKCARDVGLIIDAVSMDSVLNSNYNSITAGLSYRRANAAKVLNDQLFQTTGSLIFVRDELSKLSLDNITRVRVEGLMDDIISIIEGNDAPALLYTNPTGFDVNDEAAKNRLQDNKEFIKAEIIAHINETYREFTFDQAKCERDLGLIQDGVEYDVALGTNYNAVRDGIAYLRGTASTVINNQLEVTVDSILYFGNLLGALLSDSTAIARNNSYFDEITDILVNGTNAVDTITWSDPGVDDNKRFAREQIQINREFIVSELIDWIDTNYPSLTYNAETCARDTRYILDAVSYDVQYGGNSATVEAARAYFEGSVSVLPNDQKTETAAAFAQLANIVSSVVTETYTGQAVTGTAASATEATQVDGLIQIIEDVITADSLAGLPTKTYPDYTWATAGIQADATAISNDTASVGSTLTYISQNYGGFVYDQTKCERDTGIILDAASYDLVLGTNYNQVTSGLAYTRANSAYLQSNQKTETAGAINFAKTQVAALLTDSTAQTRSNAAFDEVLDVLNNGAGNADALSFPAASYTSVDEISAKDQLKANSAFLQTEVLEFINQNYNSVYTSMDQLKCSRDVGYLIDAMCYDIVYGGNSASVEAAKAYYVGTQSQLGVGQTIATVAAYDYLATIVGHVITENTAWTPLQSAIPQNTSGTASTQTVANYAEYLLQITEDAINAGNLDSLPDKIYPNVVNETLYNSFVTVQNAKSSIISDTIEFIDNTYTGFGYDQAKCARDVEYIIDALTYDQLYGGNSATLVAASSYFVGAVAQLGPDEVEPTIEAYEYLKELVGNIVEGVSITPTTGNTLTQDVTGPDATATQTQELADKLEIIVDTIRKNTTSNLPSRVIPDISWASAAFQADYITLQNAKSSVQTATIEFIDRRYVNFDYNQVKCSRDVGLIIEAIADDMVFGTNYKTVLAGTSYYRATATEVVGEQFPETLRAIQFVKEQVLETISIDSVKTEPEYQTVEANIDTILDIFENGESSAPSVTFPAPIGVDPNKEKARDLIIANIDFMVDEVIEFIDKNYPSLVYERTKCREDLRYIINAVIYDIMYRGNSQTVDAADEYYSGGLLVIPQNERAATIEAYRKLKNIMADIVVEFPVNSLNGVLQVTNGNPASSTEAAEVEELLDLVIELLSNGYVSEVTFDETVNKEILAGTSVSFHQYSLITASGHTFEWVGAGVNINSALPYEGGRPLVDNQVVEANGGKVYYTGTDQEGDFRIGGELVINRTSGTIEGTTFDRSLFAVLTPYILAIED